MDEGSKRCLDERAQREKWTEKWLDRGLRFFRWYINLPLTNSCIYDDVDVTVCTEKTHVCSWMWVRVKGLLCEMVICLINWTHNMAGYRARWWCHADWVRLMSWALFIEALDSPSCYMHHSHHLRLSLFFWHLFYSDKFKTALCTVDCITLSASNGSLSSKRRDVTEITSTLVCREGSICSCLNEF